MFCSIIGHHFCVICIFVFHFHPFGHLTPWKYSKALSPILVCSFTHETGETDQHFPKQLFILLQSSMFSTVAQLLLYLNIDFDMYMYSMVWLVASTLLWSDICFYFRDHVCLKFSFWMAIILELPSSLILIIILLCIVIVVVFLFVDSGTPHFRPRLFFVLRPHFKMSLFIFPWWNLFNILKLCWKSWGCYWLAVMTPFPSGGGWRGGGGGGVTGSEKSDYNFSECVDDSHFLAIFVKEKKWCQTWHVNNTWKWCHLTKENMAEHVISQKQALPDLPF